MTVKNEQINWKQNIGTYIGSQAITQLGSSMVDYSIIWYIAMETKSSILMAMAMVCVFVPKILISFYSGVWADRYNRKLLVISSDSMIALVTLIFGIVFYFGYTPIWIIYLILGIRSIGTGIQTPASKAIIPMLVPPKELIRVNGISTTLDSIIAILSPAAGGFILTYYSLDFIAFIDVFTAIIGIVTLSQIKFLNGGETTLSEKESYYKEFLESLKYLKENIIAKKFLLLYFFVFFLGVPMILLTPLKIARLFEDEVWRLSLSEMLFGIGGISGGIFISLKKIKMNSYNLVCFSFLMIGIFCFFLSWSFFSIILIAMFVIGFFISFSNSITIGMLQEHIESNYLGRIFSLIQIFSGIANLFGFVVFGVMGESISIDHIFIFTSITFIIYSTIAYLKSNTYRVKSQ